MRESFRQEWFEVPKYYEEDLLCDRKQDLYGGLRNPEKVRDFIKDVIALANSARFMGDAGRLLLGIDNNCNRLGLRGHLEDFRKDEDDGIVELVEEVRKKVSSLLKTHISPRLEFELGSNLDPNCPLIHITLPPQASAEPFSVCSDFRRLGQLLLRRGDCWYRYGESNFKLAPTELTHDIKGNKFTEVPYPLPRHWENYLNHLLSSPVPREASRLPGYQPQTVDSGKLLAEIERHFSGSDDQVLFIEGSAGTGKSTLVRRWVYQLANDALVAVEEIRRNKEFRPPVNWIPVLISLEGQTIGSLEQLASGLLDNVNYGARLWDTPPNRREFLFECSDYNWMIFLDGVDEMRSPDAQRDLYSAIRGFRKRFPRVKLVITTRPDVAWPNVREWRAVQHERIQAFEAEQIENYVFSRVSVELAERLLSELRRHPEVWQLCSVPLYLEAIVADFTELQTTSADDNTPTPWPLEESNGNPHFPDKQNHDVKKWEVPSLDESKIVFKGIPSIDQDETPTVDESSDATEVSDFQLDPLPLGVMLDRLYERIWRREKTRARKLDWTVDSWWENMCQMALKSDGHINNFPPSYLKNELGSDEAVSWLLSLGILSTAKPRGQYRFHFDISKTYFAARYLLMWSETSQLDVLWQSYQYPSTEFAGYLKNILQDISSSDFGGLFKEG